MNWFKKRKLKKHIKGLNWDLIEKDINYKIGGEYAALKWLKAYVEGRATYDPKELFEASLNRCDMDEVDIKWQRPFLRTLYKWI